MHVINCVINMPNQKATIPKISVKQLWLTVLNQKIFISKGRELLFDNIDI